MLWFRKEDAGAYRRSAPDWDDDSIASEPGIGGQKVEDVGGSPMSFFAVQTPFSSIRPKVRVEGNHLYARTSYPAQALTLFSYARRLHVDRQQRTVELDTTYFWFVSKRRVIPFDRIAYIDSKYSDVGTSWGWTDTGFGRSDKWEKYTVSLFLKDPEEQVKLFNFTGEGYVKTGTLGVLFGGDEIFDTYGDQASRFGAFMGGLQEFLDVPIGGADYIPVKDKQGLEYHCSVCKRTSIPGRDKCWMCGSPVEPVIPGEDDDQAGDAKPEMTDVAEAVSSPDVQTESHYAV